MDLQVIGDRKLKKLASSHVVHSIQRMNKKHKNEPKNKKLQNILFKKLKEDEELPARKSLAVLCDLHRRKVWFDARTVDAICNVKMMLLKVIARTIGLHCLILSKFYPFLERYFPPHQHDVTNLLAEAIQACHDEARKEAKQAISQHGLLRRNSNSTSATFRIPSSEELSTKRLDPSKLEAHIKRKLSKDERLALVRAGREVRGQYQARAVVKQKNTGGLSNQQKQHKKVMPLAAKRHRAARSRQEKKQQRKRAKKQFKGRKAWK